MDKKKNVIPESLQTDSFTEKALCSDCLTAVPYVIRLSDHEVYIEKNCNEHGIQHVTLSTNPQYWKRAVELRAKYSIGCIDEKSLPTVPIPYMLIVEALDECDTETGRSCGTCLDNNPSLLIKIYLCGSKIRNITEGYYSSLITSEIISKTAAIPCP